MSIRAARLCSLLLCLLGCVQVACQARRQATEANRPPRPGGTTKSPAEFKCGPAKDEDRPRGGRFVLAGQGPVWGIYGITLVKDTKGGDWAPMGDVVVEVYSYGGGGVNEEEVRRAVREQKRLEACVTAGDGEFSFPNLKPGRYLFRAGSRASDEHDDVYAVLTIDPGRRPSRLTILL